MGCLEWQKNGLQVPKEVQAATDEYFAQEDAMGCWIEERVRRDDTFLAQPRLTSNWAANSSNLPFPFSYACRNFRRKSLE
jgi:putative DNA primase/helicase